MAERITSQIIYVTWRDGAYYVDVPNWDGGNVVPLECVSDLIAFIRDADCTCRPETEHYAAHTCRRCELLARVGGAE